MIQEMQWGTYWWKTTLAIPKKSAPVIFRFYLIWCSLRPFENNDLLKLNFLCADFKKAGFKSEFCGLLTHVFWWKKRLSLCMCGHCAACCYHLEEFDSFCLFCPPVQWGNKSSTSSPIKCCNSSTEYSI